MKAKLIVRTIQSLTPRQKAYDVRDTELSGFLLRVAPSGAMAYFCDFRRPDGRRTRVKLGDAAVLTPVQARDEALKILAEVAKGDDPARRRKADQQSTVRVFLTKHYGPWVESHRKTGANSVERTQNLFTEFLDLRLSDVSTWRMEKWRSNRLKDGIAAATVNRDVTRLKAMLQKAVEWDVIENNPLARVRPLKVDQSPRVRYLEPEEESALRDALIRRETRIRIERESFNSWRAARSLDLYPDLGAAAFVDYLRPMVLLSLNTGIRRGELFSLKWDDIDFARRVLTVTGSNAKSGKTRHIPLNSEACDTLTKWRALTGGESALVFPGRDGGRFDNVQTAWERLLKLAGIDKFTWHQQRHHFASRLVMSGVDLNTVRELLGHGDIKTCLRYAHLSPQVKAEAVARLDRPSKSSAVVIPIKAQLVQT